MRKQLIWDEFGRKYLVKGQHSRAKFGAGKGGEERVAQRPLVDKYSINVKMKSYKCGININK